MTPAAAILRAARGDKGLTIEQVVEATGLSNNSVASAESGKRRPQASTLTTLARFYGLDLTELMSAAAPPRDGQSAQPANESVQTDTAPAQQGSDTQDRDAGPSSPPAGDQDTAAQRPQRPLRSPHEGGADLPVKRAPAA